MIEISQEWVDAHLRPRDPESDKNSFGRVLCVCGSGMYPGAAWFSAQGAVRMGSGVVTLATSRFAWPVLAAKLNEPVVRALPCDENGLVSLDALPSLLRLSERADAMLIGCGLGQSEDIRKLVCALITHAPCQIVLDADGINAIAAHKDILRQAAKPVVLTPHVREFARVSQGEEAAAFAKSNRCVVLLKGHRTTVHTPDGTAYQNHSGNPGMAKGGSGDVLAGMLVSLCGQGLQAQDAACAAAWLHGRAGDLAANELSEYGMTPTDMLERLPRILKRYNSREW